MSKNGKSRIITNQQYLGRLVPEDAARLIKWIYISNSYLRDQVTSRIRITEWLKAECDVKAINDVLKKMREGE